VLEKTGQRYGLNRGNEVKNIEAKAYLSHTRVVPDAQGCTDWLGSVDWKVEKHAPDMNGGDEGSGELRVTRGDSPSVFEGAKGDFNKNLLSKRLRISFMPSILFLSLYLVHTT
jgi:hypothetical protein